VWVGVKIRLGVVGEGNFLFKKNVLSAEPAHNENGQGCRAAIGSIKTTSTESVQQNKKKNVPPFDDGSRENFSSY